MKPAGASSVMADRARGEVEGDSDQVALWRLFELFPTPPWAARAGGDLIARLDPEGMGSVWEPACGLGHMAHGLADYFGHVRVSDIYDHGWSGSNLPPIDFLSDEADDLEPVDWIVTNPPFAPALDFARAAIRRARRGVALLCRLSFREGGEISGRDAFFFEEAPLTAKGVFAERVPMHLGRWEPQGSTATAYAWFIWMKPELEPPGLAGLRAQLGGCALDLRIGVGTKARLTRPDDARLFGARGETPLFEGMGS